MTTYTRTNRKPPKGATSDCTIGISATTYYKTAPVLVGCKNPATVTLLPLLRDGIYGIPTFVCESCATKLLARRGGEGGEG